MEDERNTSHFNQERCFFIVTSRLTDLEIFADLDCELDGQPISIAAAGRTIVVRLPGGATARQLLRLGSRDGFPRRSLWQARKLLDDNHLRLDIHLGKRLLGSIGHQVGNSAWNLLGLPKMRLSPLAVAEVWIRKSDG